MDLQCPLISGHCTGRELITAPPQRVMDLDRISLIANINFLLSYFRGCWLLEFFSVLEIGGQKMKQLLRLSWRWHCMAVSFVMKLKLLAKETL